jgi:opacity protein-like surface antigen
MRVPIIILIIAFLACLPVHADKYLNIKVGGTHYKAIKGLGLMLGVQSGYDFDEIVALGVSFDFFTKSDKNRPSITEDTIAGGTITTVDSLDIKYSYKAFPLMADLIINIPLGGPVNPFIEGGMGFITAYANFKDDSTVFEDAKGLYFGFCWKAGAGAAWNMGKNSALFAQIVYHNSEPTRKERFALELSGIELSIGVRLYIR